MVPSLAGWKLLPNPTLVEQAREELKKQIAARAYQTGEFSLVAGGTTNYYIDLKQITLAPSLTLAAILVLDAIQDDRPDAVGGLTTGADPITSAVTALSMFTPHPLTGFLVRKQVKDHGTRKQVEGPALKPGMRVVIVEDVITTGFSCRQAIKAAEERGAQVCRVVAVVDRCEGGIESLQKDGYATTSLFTIDEIRELVPGE